LIGIDRDDAALQIAKGNLKKYSSQVQLINGSYSDSDVVLKEIGYKNVVGILLDLGLSSAQLADKNRGFSYDGNGELDMRFNSNSGITATEFINRNSEEQIADIIWNYGEERYSRKIANRIKNSQSINTVNDLCEAIRKATPPKNRNRSYARVFQALRIAVNDELNHLQLFLEKLINLLSIGGHIVILSYHSLEDRLVKIAFKKYKTDGKLNIITKKPLIASPLEVKSNSRSKSAKMRVGERIA
jgi:16S rRNA (cytosine1402-N4)-methyltransferase